MEKAKHIFVYPLILVWLVIFFHDTIPHNHFHHQTVAELAKECVVGNTSSCCQHIDESTKHPTCQFSVKLLIKISIDHAWVVPSQMKIFVRDAGKTTFGNYPESFHIKTLYRYQYALRAPPVA